MKVDAVRSEDSTDFRKASVQSVPEQLVDEHPLSQLDVYPYHMSVRRQTSKRSGALSVIAGLSLAVAIYIYSGMLLEAWRSEPSAYSISRHLVPREDSIDLLPDIGFTLNVDHQTFYNESFFRWSFNQRGIFDGDLSPKPRLKIPIPTEDTLIGNPKKFEEGEIGRHQAHRMIVGWKDDDAGFQGPSINGEYSDHEYYYVEAVLEPCKFYKPGTFEGTCASDNELADFLASNDVEVSVSYKGIPSFGQDPTWNDIIFINLEDKWLGTEIYWSHVNAQRNNWLNIEENEVWLEFTRFYTRRADKIHHEDEIMKFYFREDNKSVEQVEDSFNALNFMEGIGSIWTFIGLTIGAVAYNINRSLNDENVENTFKRFGHASTAKKHFDKLQKSSPDYWNKERDLLQLLMQDHYASQTALQKTIIQQMKEK